MRSTEQLAVGLLLAIAMTIALALMLGGCALDANPTQISFDGRTYDVTYDEQGPCFATADLTVRCFGRGTLLALDFTGDGTDDLALFRDERDGFRHTFAYLDIYVNDGTPLDAVVVVSAKWKEGHWTWIDPARYPGLHSKKFERFMHDQDAVHY